MNRDEYLVDAKEFAAKAKDQADVFAHEYGEKYNYGYNSAKLNFLAGLTYAAIVQAAAMESIAKILENLSADDSE